MIPEDQIIDIITVKPVTAIEWLKSLRPMLPLSGEAQIPTPMSNGELKRLLQDGGVQLNGRRIKPDEKVDFPVTELIFWPRSQKKRCTLY